MVLVVAAAFLTGAFLVAAVFAVADVVAFLAGAFLVVVALVAAFFAGAFLVAGLSAAFLVGAASFTGPLVPATATCQL